MRKNVSRLLAYMLAVLVTFTSVTDYCLAAPATEDTYVEAVSAESLDDAEMENPAMAESETEEAVTEDSAEEVLAEESAVTEDVPDDLKAEETVVTAIASENVTGTVTEGETIITAEETGDIIASGKINNGTEEGITWSVDSNGLLLIVGEGDFQEVNDEGGFTGLSGSDMPWYSYRDLITDIEMSVNSITSFSYVLEDLPSARTLDMSGTDFSDVDVNTYINFNLYGLNTIITPQNTKGNYFIYSMNSTEKSYYDQDGWMVSGFPASDLPVTLTTQVPDSEQKIGKKSGSFTCQESYDEDGENKSTDHEVNWSISENGVLTIDGEYYTSGAGNTPWRVYAKNIKSATLNISRAELLVDFFEGCRNLEEINVPNGPITGITDMCNIFCNCSSLTSVDLSVFDTSSTTNMSWMFGYCSSLADLNLAGFNTSNATNMAYMFYNCDGLSELDLSAWDMANVTSVYGMFTYCNNLESLDVSSFSFTENTNCSDMLRGCNKLATIQTPANLAATITLPSESLWYRAGGVCVNILPKNTKSQILSTTRPENASGIGGFIDNEKGGITWSISENHLTVSGNGELKNGTYD